MQIVATVGVAISGLSDRQAELLERASTGLNVAAERLATYIKDEKLSGQVLARRSRRLVRSVHTEPAQGASDGVISAFVAAAGGVAWYGRVHEFGGARSYQIRSKLPGGWLRFIGRDAQTVFARLVNHPPLAKRSFMATSAAERKGDVLEQVQAAVTQ